MKRKLKLKNKSNFFKKNKLSLIILFIIITTICFLVLLNKKMLPVLFDYVEKDTTKISMEIITKTISEEIKELDEIENLITTIYNKNNEIVSIDFDSQNINKVLYSINNSIQKNIKDIEYKNYIKKEGNVYYIPSGIISGSSLLSNIGPKIPIRTYIIGNAITNIKTDIKSYGINNVLLKVYIQVETTVNVVLPFVSKETKISLDVPIAMKIIQGKIPNVYGGFFSNSSSLQGLS